VWANGDTIAAGADSIVHASTDGGATWKTSAKVVEGVTSIEAVRVRNGLLYAGTRGQGVFISDDLGDTWLAFNQGLVGGILDTQLHIVDFLVHGDSLFVATSGAGVWVRDLRGGTWSHFGNTFEANSASNMNDIAAGGTRLFASSGFNGTAFFRDPGDADWTRSYLNNTGLAPGLAALVAAWTGGGWVVGANTGVFRSASGHELWTFVDLDLGIVLFASFVTRGRELFGMFNAGGQAVLERSIDDGATWEFLDGQPAVFVFEMAMSGAHLYAGRVDGLWRRSAPTAVRPASWSSAKSRFR
jgi:photosystem II stability/assembly factor-like uncharacterized protein